MSNEYLQTIFFFRKNGVMNWSHLRKGTIPYSYKHLQINYLEIHTVSYFILDLPRGSDGKVSACNVGDPGSIPGLGRSPGEGNGNPLQYSCLEKSHDRKILIGKINYLEIHTVFYVIGRKKTDSERLSDLLKLTSW